MSEARSSELPPTDPPPQEGASPSKLGALLSWGITLVVVVGLGLTLWLLPHPELPAGRQAPHSGAVSVTEAHTIRILAGTPFVKRLRVATAKSQLTEQAIVVVTGSVLASVPATAYPSTAVWEFANADLISTYSEWLQTDADVAFHRRQLSNTRSLTAKRVETQGAVVERLQRLVEVGSDSPRDLAQERANLMQGKLESDSQIHGAEASLNSDVRRQAALERKLEQSGLEPDLLLDVVPGRVLITADVPETRMGGLHEGQRCSVRFYASPDKPISGHVARILPTLSTMQRALRVLVMLDGPSSDARPGMFADVGIGTDERTAVMVPQASIVHVGREDYVLTAVRPDEWRVTPVALGASQGNDVEVTQGVPASTSLLADGVVLLKPVIAEVLQSETNP
ncbi:MAG: Cobalt/zinc/cadmium efflux transporter, rane fusion protein CzcB family [Myxococcaceae bacterium]|nr:Cobalt/zinc/cadmium efflux transporter, rane fusion protein CzcB family [Myxococcaceae bacterium]